MGLRYDPYSQSADAVCSLAEAAAQSAYLVGVAHPKSVRYVQIHEEFIFTALLDHQVDVCYTWFARIWEDAIYCPHHL